MTWLTPRATKQIQGPTTELKESTAEDAAVVQYGVSETWFVSGARMTRS